MARNTSCRKRRALNVGARIAAKPSIGVVAGTTVFSADVDVTYGRKRIESCAAAVAGGAIVSNSDVVEGGNARQRSNGVRSLHTITVVK